MSIGIGIDVAKVTSKTIKDLECTIRELGEANYKQYKYILELEENYKLLMIAMRSQTHELNKAN